MALFAIEMLKKKKKSVQRESTEFSIIKKKRNLKEKTQCRDKRVLDVLRKMTVCRMHLVNQSRRIEGE